MADIFDEIETGQKQDIFDSISADAASGTDSVSLVSPEKDWTPYAFHEAFPLAGAMAGGFAKTVSKRIPYSGVLAAGGEAAKQIYQSGIIPGTPKPSYFEPGVLKNLNEPPRTAWEAAARIGLTGLEYSVAQGAGELLNIGLAGAMPQVRPEYLQPELKSAENFLSPFMQRTPNLTQKALDAARGRLGLQVPERQAVFTIGQQVHPQSSVAKFENIVRSSFFGGDPIKKLEFKAEQAVEQAKEYVSKRFWGNFEKIPPSEQGNAFVEAYTSGEKIFKSEAQAGYKALDESMGAVEIPIMKTRTSPILDAKGNPIVIVEPTMSNAFVDITPLKAQAKEMVAHAGKYKNIASSDMGDNLLSQVASLPDRYSFTDAIELRSRLWKAKQMIGAKNGYQDVAIAHATDFMKSVDESMKVSAEKLAPDLYEQWTKVSANYKQGMEKFHNDFIDGLVEKLKTNPSAVSRLVFKNGAPEDIQRVKAVTDPETFQTLKAGWIENWLTMASKPTNQNPAGKIKGDDLYRILKTKGGNYTDWWESETIKQMFNPEDIRLMKDFTTAVQTTQKKPSGEGASILIQLMQAGALTAVVTARPIIQAIKNEDPTIAWTDIAGAIALLGVPRILGKMFVNPEYQKIFLEGLKADTMRKIPAITKLITATMRIDAEMSNESPPISTKPEQVAPVGTRGALK